MARVARMRTFMMALYSPPFSIGLPFPPPPPSFHPLVRGGSEWGDPKFRGLTRCDDDVVDVDDDTSSLSLWVMVGRRWEVVVAHTETFKRRLGRDGVGARS